MKNLFKNLLDRIPKNVITNCFGNKYLTRWYFIKRKNFAVYLHCFHRSDEDRALHDHPWDFISIIIWRGYREHTNVRCPLCVGGIGYNVFAPVKCPVCDGREKIPSIKRKWPGMILYRPAEWTHRVELIKDKPALTLIIRFKNRREWGYHLPEGWMSNVLWWRKNCE